MLLKFSAWEIGILHTDFSWVGEHPAKQWGAGGELNVKAMALNPQLHKVFNSTGTLDGRLQAQIYFGTQSAGSREDRRCSYTREQMQTAQNAVVWWRI